MDSAWEICMADSENMRYRWRKKFVESLRTQKKGCWNNEECNHGWQVPGYRLGEGPTLHISHGSDVFSLPFARRLIPEFRTPAAEALFSNFSQLKTMGIGSNNDNEFLFHVCRGSTVQRAGSLATVITALVLPLLTSTSWP